MLIRKGGKKCGKVEKATYAYYLMIQSYNSAESTGY